LVLAAICAALARGHAPRFADRLVGSWWTVPVGAATAVCAAGALVALRRDRVRVARILAIATASLFVVGWGAAQYPYLLAPYLRIEDAAAPPVTLRVLVPILLAGVVVLLPCLWWLFRVFKFARS
ncbi:MAG: cytochrome d ubiquinol oxidase subunit II, partial [Deltaproteobacteria bacterium]|nr:cytochrome d ubiquinol oxidase subunit II [Deltaproteobacteria bacterium]